MKTKITILLLFLLSQVYAQQESYPTLKAQQYAESAEAAYAQNNLTEAEKYTRFTLRELKIAAAKDTPLYVKWREKHGELLHAMGNAPAALKLFQENAAEVEKHFGKISKSYLYNRDNIAETLTWQYTNYAEAVPYREEAVAIAEQIYEEGSPEFIVTLYTLVGEYRNAEYFDKALAIFPRLMQLEEKHFGKDHPRYGHDLLQWGTVYALQANWTEAIPRLKEGWRIFSNIEGTDHELATLIYKHLADAHLATGDYKKALYYARLNEEYYYAHEGQTLPYLGYTYLTIGDIFKNYGQLDSALVYYHKSEDYTIEHLGKEHRTYQTIIGIKARFNRENGQYKTAIEQYKQQIKWFKDNPGQQLMTEAMPEEGLLSCYYLTSEYDKALALYETVLAQNKTLYGESSFSVSEIYMLGAYLFRKLGRKEDSQIAYFKWAQTYQNFVQNIFLHLPEERQKMLLSKTILLQNLLLSFAAQEDGQAFVSAGLDFALRYKNLILQSKIDRKTIAQRAGVEVVDLLARQQSMGVSLAQYYSQGQGTQSPEFAQIKKDYDALSEKLAQISADLLPIQSTSWQELQKQIKKDEAILETVRFQYVNENKQLSDSILYFAYLLKSDAKPKRIFLFEEKETGTLEAVRNRYTSKTSDAPTWRKLLSEKLLPELEGIKTLYYAPTGLLHRVNLGAVPIDETEIWAEHFDLHLLNNNNQLVTKEKTFSKPKSAVIYGGIDYNFYDINATSDNLVEVKKIPKLGDNYRSWRGKDWNYLDWSAKEAQQITDLLRRKKVKTQLLTGQNATEESFKNLGRDSLSPQILHLATHGFFFPNPKKDTSTEFRNSTHPLIRSGLVLAGANHVWKGEKAIENREDGILTAYEISQMNLSNTDLVVLSACDTALGDIEDNEGVYGLQRAFKTAGARYILMSLWSVNDKKTYEFMTRFYELYQNEGKTVPEAYQIAQSEMRQSSLRFDTHAWAGFVLVE